MLFVTKLRRRRRPFLNGARRVALLWDYPQEHLVVLKDEEVCPFGKFEIILPQFCCLSDPLTNKHCMAWSSMVNLRIDSRACRKYRILLPKRQRSNSYLELSKENIWGDMMLSHWPCFTWKFFMIKFHKILKLIFQKPPSSLWNICTEHWRTCVKSFSNYAIHLFPS